MEVTSDTAKLLLEIGLMAAWRGETADARTILEALQALRPDSPLPCIGLAVVCMNVGRYEVAIRILEESLEKDRDCDLTRCHLALACKISGFDSRCRSMCEEVLVSRRDETAVELARTLLAVPAGRAASEVTSA